MTGTGEFEGWFGVLKGGITEFKNAELEMQKNILGRELASDNSNFQNFGVIDGSTATVTKSDSAWVLDPKSKLNTFSPAEDPLPADWHIQLTRLATLPDAGRIKFVSGQEYYGHCGHRWWNSSGSISASE